MKFKKLIIYLSLLILCLTLAGATIRGESEKPGNNSGNCITKVEFPEVRGSSLAPLINPGQAIKLVYGYYNCHPVEREDIIAYKYAGNDAPIIKIVKAIPKDKWSLKKNNRLNSYQIMVNGRPLRNSEGKSYNIPESKIKMLKLYVQGYPVIPDNTYLILGNQVSGSLDATRFGLIDKGDILGKVEEIPINPVNSVPVIESFAPANDVSMNVGGSQEFSVAVSDADSDDTLSVQWYVDDLPVAGQTQNSFTFDASEAGVFEVKVLVTDSKDYSTRKWFVTVEQGTGGFSITGAAVGVAKQGSSLWDWLRSLF